MKTNGQHVKLGRVLMCNDCRELIVYYDNFRNNKEFELLFQAGMSLQIFRKTFPEICESKLFPQQLKSLRKNINNLEAKLEQLSPTNNIYKPLKDITKQLEVLLGLYIKGIIND
ncbi:hypothetical protein CGJ02_23895 [Vibrio parahaemolyticus]|nr:hypothetical protein CGJ02_23895 [Vibrio parahaemolyticus]